MCCTFGDLTDVHWWRELQLPNRTIIGRDGRILAETPDWIATDGRRGLFAEIAGKTTFTARERSSPPCASPATWTASRADPAHGQLLRAGRQAARDRDHRQWYIRNGGRDADLRAALIDRGDEIDLAPRYMQTPLDNWIDGLNGDWLISRQRFFGIAFPVWYRLDADGEPDHDHPDPRDEADAPGRPARRRPAGLRGVTARPSRRLHRRSRCPRHLGHVLTHPADRRWLGAATTTCSSASSRWTCAPRPTTSSAPGCSRPCSRATSSTRRPVAPRRHLAASRRPRPQEDVQVQGQRRCPRDLEHLWRRRRTLARRSARPGTDSPFDERR